MDIDEDAQQAPSPAPAEFWPRLTRATAGRTAPLAVLDQQALTQNAHDLLRRADGTPIRVASKSIRCRAVLDAVLQLPGYRGILAYGLAEAVWLAADHDDVLVGYPDLDPAALHTLAGDEQLAARVTLMVDSVEHLDLVESVLTGPHPPLRVCLDLDVAYDLPGLRVGVRRSPLREAEQVRRLAAEVVDRPGFTLVGLMAYEAQLAGLGDRPTGAAATQLRIRVIQQLQRRSRPDVSSRRRAAVAAIADLAELEFVNGGGTGSLEFTASDPSVTEVAAGSGLFGSHLFDHYRTFRPWPAASFCLPVVRRPVADTVTLLGGGWIASGPSGRDRQPLPVWPEGLQLLPAEMAGEVQTPLRGDAASSLRLGDRVWFRHAKAGELSEHVNAFLLIDGDRVIEELLTYRGEGKAFL